MIRGLLLCLMLLGTARSQYWSTSGWYYYFYSDYDSNEECDAPAEVISDERQLTSPGYPNNDYTNNLCISWLVVGPSDKRVRLSFNDFDLEQHISCRYDVLIAYDGSSPTSQTLAHLCGDVLPADIVSSRAAIYLEFRTDHSVVHSGFGLQILFEEFEFETTTTPAPCGENLYITQPYTVDSPGYPGNYANNLECFWAIDAPADKCIRVHFEAMHMEYSGGCIFDSLSFHNGPDETSDELAEYCISSPPEDLVACVDSLLMVFTTDSSVVATGFRLTISAEDAPTPNLLERTIGDATYLALPDFQFIPTGHNLSMSWSFTAAPNQVIHVYVLDFEMGGDQCGCQCEGVRLYDGPTRDSELYGTVCGSYDQGVDIISSTGPSVFVEFYTDGSNTPRSASVLFVPKDNGEGNGGVTSEEVSSEEECTYIAAGAHVGTPGMNEWCVTNCASGNCPPTHCEYTC